MSTCVAVRQVSKSYHDGESRNQVLRGVALSLPTGSSLALTGPSGSGKSTLLNLIAGLMAVDEGEIDILSHDQRFALHRMNERERTLCRRRHIAYIHQFFNLVPTLTVLENVALPGYLNGARPGRDRCLELLARFGLQDAADRFPERLSGGEQQRVAVARSLALDVAVLLADEPTGNLDQDNAQQVASALFAAAREQGLGLIVATHSSRVAELAEQQLQLAKTPT
ncbi:MAG: ABC transporter ATP-binding protein [Pseudomonadota bacterium]